jgi:hypothetical protein
MIFLLPAPESFCFLMPPIISFLLLTHVGENLQHKCKEQKEQKAPL